MQEVDEHFKILKCVWVGEDRCKYLQMRETRAVKFLNFLDSTANKIYQKFDGS